MKKLLLVWLFITAHAISTAQKIGPVSITYGKEITDDKQKIVRIAGEANGKIYTLAIKGKKNYIKTFTKDLSPLKTNYIDKKKLKLGKKKINFEDIFVLNNHIYVFGSIFDSKAKKLDLYAFPVNEDGVMQANKKLISSAKVTKSSERGAYFFKQSPNDDKLLILHGTLFKKQDLIKYELRLIDDNLNEVMKRIEKVPFKDRRGLRFRISDFDMDINENIFLVINETYRDRKKKQNIEKLYLHSYKKANDYKKDVLEVDVKNKSIMNCEMLPTSKGIIHLAGLYSGVSKRGRAKWRLKGTYSASIDIDTNKLNKIVFTPFDYKTKVQLIGKRRAAKGKDVNPFYVTHSLIEKEDGGIILMSEFQYVQEGKSSGIGPFAVTPIVFNNNEVIVTSFNPDGTVKWTGVVPKKQRAAYSVVSFNMFFATGNANFAIGVGISLPLGVLGKGPEYLSVLPIYNDKKLTLIYNDHIKNKGITDMDKIKRMSNFNKSIISIMTFDENGKVSRIDQKKYVKEQLILRPRVYYRRTPVDYIIYASKRKSDKLGELILND